VAILGLDIGGANIKAADAAGRAINRPFAIWRQYEGLTTEIASILHAFPETDQIALTMTAELADCFSTKSEGVRFILEAVDAAVEDQRNPLTLTPSASRGAGVSPPGRGEATGGAHRANDSPTRNPTCDAHEKSPPGRGEGTGGAHRANDSPTRNPTCDAHEKSPQGRGEGTGDLHRANDIPTRNPSCDAHEKSPRFVREGTGVVVWSTEGEFISSTDARDCPQKVAAANWHALATWYGRFVPEGTSLLIDIGTTTTDIIPLLHGKPVPMGLTDVDRLQSGELSYFGVKRTPVCAVAHSVPFRNGYCPLAAELFATSLDIYLLLGDIAEDERNVDTANGKPATKAAAHDRLARMLCCDRNEISFDETVEIARFLADVQRQRLAGALERVVQRLPDKCQAVVLSGSGAFLAQQLVSENRHLSNINVVSLARQLSPNVSEAACAYAVAQLATSMKQLESTKI